MENPPTQTPKEVRIEPSNVEEQAGLYLSSPLHVEEIASERIESEAYNASKHEPQSKASSRDEKPALTWNR